MRPSLVRAGVLFFAIAAYPPREIRAQQSPVIRRLEAELWARIGDRVRRNHGLSVDSAEFDLRLPIQGEPDEIFGPTAHARSALAVASARFEALDSIITARAIGLSEGRYDLRIEDRQGNCLAVHQFVRLVSDTIIERGTRTTERCQPLYMAEVVRRSRRLARLPLSAGDLDAQWAVALAAQGWADVYPDSIVITTTMLALRASHPLPDTEANRVDSVTAGLATGGPRWGIVRNSGPVVVDTVLRKGGQWSRRQKRFTIPIGSGNVLRESWPVFEVHLSAPRTESNPLGIASTYAHAPRDFFATVSPPPR